MSKFMLEENNIFWWKLKRIIILLCYWIDEYNFIYGACLDANFYGSFDTPVIAKNACFYDQDCIAVVYRFSKHDFSLCKKSFAIAANNPCCTCVYKKEESYGNNYVFYLYRYSKFFFKN